MKDYSYNIIIRRCLLTLALAAVGGAAWAIDVTTVEELKTVLTGSEATITLTSDITLDETLTISRDVTLDLNGHNVTANNVRAFHITAGTVNITSTIPARIFAGGTIADNSSVIRVGNNGDGGKTSVSLTLGEKVEVFSNACYGVTVFGNGTTETLTVNGTVSTTGVPAISGNGSAGYDGTIITIGEHATITTDNDVAIYHPQSGTLTVNGTVTGAGGIEMKGGQLVVGEHAKVTATAATPTHTENNDGCSTKGYAIAIVENGKYAGVSTVNISKDATIEGPVAVVKDSDKKDGAPVLEFDPAGLQMNVKVKDNSSSKILGQFLTLEDAMREVPASGSTIQLLADQTLTNTLKTSNSYTLDLNGHSLTCDGDRALHVMGGDVSITNTSSPTTESIISSVGGVASNSSVIRLGDNTGEARTASLTIGTNVTVSAETCYGITVFGNRTTETLTVNGNVKTINYPAIGGNGSAGYGGTTITVSAGAEVTSEHELAIYHPQDGTLTVNGTVSGAGGIEMKGGRLTVGATAQIAATGTPTHNPDSNGSSTLGYAIAIVENGGGYAGVKAVSIDNGAKINGIVAQLQDSPIASGFNPTYSGDAVSKKVAAIGKDEYFTLKDAITIVPAKGTVTLLDDLAFTDDPFVMDQDKAYTLDLNGHKLTGSGCTALRITHGQVTLSGDEGSTVTSTVAAPKPVVELGGSEGSNRTVGLTVDENVLITSSSAVGILLKGDKTRETLEVKGSVTTTNQCAIVTADEVERIHIAADATVKTTATVPAAPSAGLSAIYQTHNGELVIDGTVIGSVAASGTTAGAIEMKGGNLTVNAGATITAAGTPTHTPTTSPDPSAGGEKTAPSTNGYAIAIVENAGFPGVMQANISSSATITGVIACLVDSKNTYAAETHFTGDVTMIAETANAAGHGEKYTSLANAISAAATGNEVKLLDDITVTKTLTITKPLTLNMDDYSITGKQTLGATIILSADATLKHGDILSDRDGISVTAGTVTLQQLTVKTAGKSLAISDDAIAVTLDKASTFTSTGDNTLALSAGTLTLNGKVLNTATEAGKHAIAATGTAALTVESTSTISSALGNGIDWASTRALTVKGGKVSGAEAVHASAGTVTISGGTFTGAGHGVNIAGSTSAPSITGGTFVCGKDETYAPITATTATLFVSGDYFSKPIAQSVCANGYMVAPNPKSNGMHYLVNELVINDGTAWTSPTESYVIGTAKYVRNSGMGASGTHFGTLCLPFSFASNAVDDMTFYTVNRIENNTLYLDAITSGTIEAGTPVVFQFTEATTEFTIESTNATIPATGATSANNLVGTFAKKELTTSTSPTASSVYYLNGDAFHQASQTLTVPAYRAYINYPASPSNRRVLYIHTDDALLTGVSDDALRYDDDTLRIDDAVIYDLEGRRHDTLQPGLNVVRTSDGRTIKVVVK